jgi:hypothetical protein
MTVFEGAYRAYLQAREAARQSEREAQAPARAEPKPADGRPSNGKPGLSPFQRQRRLAEIEQKIHQLEIRLVELSGELGEASAAGAVERVRNLGEAYTDTEDQLDSALREWETLLE